MENILFANMEEQCVVDANIGDIHSALELSKVLTSNGVEHYILNSDEVSSLEFPEIEKVLCCDFSSTLSMTYDAGLTLIAGLLNYNTRDGYFICSNHGNFLNLIENSEG